MSTHKSLVEIWKEKLQKVLPLIVEDYNNFITETGGEIGELDLEDIVQERVEPLLTRAMDEAAHGAAEAGSVGMRELVEKCKRNVCESCAEMRGFNAAIDQSRAQIKSYFNEDV